MRVRSNSKNTSTQRGLYARINVFFTLRKPIMKLYVKTNGCQMNEYDSSRMGDLLRESHGMELTSLPEEADVLLLNTCSVREKAQEKVFSQLGKWRPFKQLRPEVV